MVISYIRILTLLIAMQEHQNREEKKHTENESGYRLVVLAGRVWDRVKIGFCRLF